MGVPGEDNAGHCQGRLLQLPSHSCCVPGCTRAWPIYSCHGENEAYRIITPPTAVSSPGNKYLFVNLKGKYNKIIMKIYVQWWLTNLHYLTKLIYHPLLSAGCSSSLTNLLNKRGNWAQLWHHSFQDFHIQNSNTFHLNGLVTQKWIKTALSKESHFYVQCNFSKNSVNRLVSLPTIRFLPFVITLQLQQQLKRIAQ